MDKFNKKIGLRIKKFRENSGLSQEQLANLLKMNRVSLSQIENGRRKINVKEIAKFSKVFNINADILLDLKKDIKVVLSKKRKNIPKKKEVRINVPEKNLEKFKEVLLYILNKVGSKPNVGETVLYKLLYFIDFDFYEKYEEQLMGATYKKNYYGPTPLEFKNIVKKLIGRDIEKVKSRYFQYPQNKYLPLRKPNLDKLKANEIKVIDEVLDRLSNYDAYGISEYSHNDIPWLTTEKGDIIDYEKVFYRTFPYSVRNYSEAESI